VHAKVTGGQVQPEDWRPMCWSTKTHQIFKWKAQR
jgi:hypothetical protein